MVDRGAHSIEMKKSISNFFTAQPCVRTNLPARRREQRSKHIWLETSASIASTVIGHLEQQRFPQYMISHSLNPLMLPSPESLSTYDIWLYAS